AEITRQLLERLPVSPSEEMLTELAAAILGCDTLDIIVTHTENKRVCSRRARDRASFACTRFELEARDPPGSGDRGLLKVILVKLKRDIRSLRLNTYSVPHHQIYQS